MASVKTLAWQISMVCTDAAKPLPAAAGRTDPGRAGTTARGYGWQWQRLRLEILQRDSWQCQACKRAGRLTPAREVDHVLNKAAGGTDAPDNLAAICTPCHSLKTAEEIRAGQGIPHPGASRTR